MTDLFLKIINMSISASWLVLAVLLLRVVFKKAPKWVNVLLWGIVAVRLAFPFSIGSALSLIPSAETIPAEVITGPSFDVQTGIAPIDDQINNYLGDRYFEGVTVPANNGFNVMSVLSIVWGVGVLLLAAYTAISYWCLHRKISEATVLRDNIYQSEHVPSPFVLGFIKPKIYLPYGMNKQDLGHVVAHEQAHIRRRDHWWKPLGFFLLTIHWFNPLMWMAYVLLCRDIELACDEKVIKELGDEQRADYTQALVTCSINRRTIAACPLAFGEVGVKERVKSVMSYKKPAFWVIVLSIVICTVVAVCFLTNPVSSEEPDLSFLNYKNAVNLVIEQDEIMAIHCPSNDVSGNSNQILIGAAHGKDLAKYLSQQDWKKCKAPRNTLASPGSVEFVIDDEYRILVHQRKSGALRQYALVKFQNEVQYYSISRNDYADAVAMLHAPAMNPETIARKSYVYENEGFMGNFTITLNTDGTFTYYEGGASSYIGRGNWEREDDVLTLSDNDFPFVNRFLIAEDELIFIETGSTNFLHIKVKNGERFFVSGASEPVDDVPLATVVNIDLDHDGIDEEMVIVRETEDNWLYELSIVENGTVLWSRELSTAHAGWGTILLYHDNGKDYLVEYDPYMNTGIGAYTCRVFSLENGRETVMREWSVQFETPTLKTSEMERFEEEVGQLLQHCTVLLSTEQGIPVDVPTEAVALPQIYPVRFDVGSFDDLLSSVILDHFKPSDPDGLIHVESHVFLTTETVSGTPLFSADDHAEKVTAYLLVHHVKYSTYGGTLEAVGGSYVPTAVTFKVTESGKYILEEYWEPRDGVYYADDIRKKFPGASADDALNDQAYIEELKTENYNKALAYLNSNSSLDVMIEELLGEIQSSPAHSSNPGDYIREHETEYNELLGYGKYTLRYCFTEFLQGSQYDLRGHIMALACEDIMLAWDEAYMIDGALFTGQDRFDEFRRNAESLAVQYSPEELEKTYPGAFLLLQMMDDTMTPR